MTGNDDIIASEIASVSPNRTVISQVRLSKPIRVRVVRRHYETAKRIMDLTISVLLLPIIVPLMAACALAVWIEDRGPVLFRQRRAGRYGTKFEMFKFRTMVVNAEEMKKELAHLSQLTWPDFKIADDPRITRVGKFLRKTSLDELPQIINVLRGVMSLVGPRPTSFGADTYQLWQTERLEVLPGITGLWQISGRSDVDFDDRLKLDIEYIEHRSIWLDLKIIFRTAFAVVSPKGAY